MSENIQAYHNKTEGNFFKNLKATREKQYITYS